MFWNDQSVSFTSDQKHESDLKQNWTQLRHFFLAQFYMLFIAGSVIPSVSRRYNFLISFYEIWPDPVSGLIKFRIKFQDWLFWVQTSSMIHDPPTLLFAGLLWSDRRVDSGQPEHRSRNCRGSHWSTNPWNHICILPLQSCIKVCSQIAFVVMGEKFDSSIPSML